VSSSNGLVKLEVVGQRVRGGGVRFQNSQPFETFVNHGPNQTLSSVKNVIVQQGELRGLVDFDVVCYGDPLYWLALTRAAVFADVGNPGVPYLEALERLCNMDESEQEALRVYTAIHVMDFARFETHPEKLERLLQIIRTSLETR
jgi:hypothetical protein